MAKSIKSTISTHPYDFSEFENPSVPFEVKQKKLEFLTAEKPKDEENKGNLPLRAG